MRNRHALLWAVILAVATIARTTSSLAAEPYSKGGSDSGIKLARYGAPMVLRPKIAAWGAHLGVGPNFVGEKGLMMGQWTLTNIDVEDCLLLVGLQDHDVVIGTGIVKKKGGETIDLRTLDVRTTREALDLLKSEDPVQRARGAWALGEISDKQSVPVLAQALSDGAWVVRRYALLSLSQQADPEQVLTSALKSVEDKEGVVALAAIRILRERGKGDKRVVPALLKHIEEDKDWLVAKASITALGDLGDESTLQPLREALKKEPFLTEDTLQETIKKIEQRPPASGHR